MTGMEGRRITLDDAERTGVNRPAHNRIANVKGYSTTTGILHRLCECFECRLDRLAEYLPDKQGQL
ncbi:helix-turn-helix domain-containing protein [Sedimenticola selenatireducens]|uniref:helix-turn-helix domain-containing protein n=1 Tax=Sedimenticola selenatireducens TaxID=191960 RepID=UPI0004BAB952|nr:hypothetical protein [Sedimenticola selenatireducens]